jgi:hypothetical protein
VRAGKSTVGQSVKGTRVNGPQCIVRAFEDTAHHCPIAIIIIIIINAI